MRYLIVGLGNPGPDYAKTRHNFGFMAVEELARRNNLSFTRSEKKSQIADGMIGDKRVLRVNSNDMKQRCRGARPDRLL